MFILVGVTMTRKIDDRKIELLLELHKTGISSVDAGKAVGVSYQTALNVWRKHGLDPNFNRKRTLYSTIRPVLEFVKEGHSTKEAASAFPLSEATIRRCIKEYEKAEPLLHGFGSQLKGLLRSKENPAKELRVVPLPYDLRAGLIRRNRYYPARILEKKGTNIFGEREEKPNRPSKGLHAALLCGSMPIINSSQRKEMNPPPNVPVHLTPGIINISIFFPNRNYNRQRVKAR